jgi:hypothetical protein
VRQKVNRKEKAFALFGEGKTASSPEVKELQLKNQTRNNYYYEWKKRGNVGNTTVKGSQPLPGGESIGAVDESKIQPEVKEPEVKEPQQEEPEVKEPEVKEPEVKEPEVKGESFGAVSESETPKGKDGKPEGPERKLATRIADDGIKCTVFLSLQTLSLYRIAAATQAEINGGEELLLGDFLDTCAEDFFRVRGRKLGLINIGGK